MIRENKCIVMDLDGTICPEKTSDQCYDDVQPYAAVVALLRDYQAAGHYIIIQTARNMRTYQGNVGLITANTAKQTMAWLDRHAIPYDEIHFGKPWSGHGGFYVDDKAIRPDEFLSQSRDEIIATLAESKARTAALTDQSPKKTGKITP